jgi:hypothetical protein
MRAWTAPVFLKDFLAEDSKFLATTVALAFPLDWYWLNFARVLDPFSCLKMVSRETKADLPSLKLKLVGEEMTPWLTFPEFLKDKITWSKALAKAAAATNCPWEKFWTTVFISESLERFLACLERTTLSFLDL